MMSDEEILAADDGLLEPLKAYNTKFEREFSRNCEAYFSSLLKQSGVDVAENRATVAEYDAETRLADEAGRRAADHRTLRGLFVILIVLGAVLFLVGIILLINEQVASGAALTAIGPVLVIACILFIVLYSLPRIRQNTEEERVHRAEAGEHSRKAWRQTEGLNALFEDGVTKKLIEQTVPLFELDEFFDVRRYDLLHGKYGYDGNPDPNASTIAVLTGQIAGNPFAVDRVLRRTMGTQTYHGSISISWVTYEQDAQGNSRSVTHTQTLTASVTKPKPFYSAKTRLVYGNEAAPALHFSREPSHVEDLDEKARENRVKRGAKKIRKRQEKTMGTGSSFTGMGNETFDVLFGAVDRDNDVEFRLLFTPLAQKNMLALLTDSEHYGDDFRMRKDGCLNVIVSDHSACWDMVERRENYLSYSVDIARRSFMDFNTAYFRSLYFDLAPLLSIPLYQQHRPQEYLYREEYPRHFTEQETEFAVNTIAKSAFAPNGAATQCILKTTFLQTDGESDRVRVTASAYREVMHTEEVSVSGDDGHMHDVPVDWIEYVPISAETDVELKRIGLTDREFRREATEGKYVDAIAKHGRIAYGYRHGILCCIVPDAQAGFDDDFTLEK